MDILKELKNFFKRKQKDPLEELDDLIEEFNAITRDKNMKQLDYFNNSSNRVVDTKVHSSGLPIFNWFKRLPNNKWGVVTHFNEKEGDTTQVKLKSGDFVNVLLGAYSEEYGVFEVVPTKKRRKTSKKSKEFSLEEVKQILSPKNKEE